MTRFRIIYEERSIHFGKKPLTLETDFTVEDPTSDPDTAALARARSFVAKRDSLIARGSCKLLDLRKIISEETVSVLTT